MGLVVTTFLLAAALVFASEVMYRFGRTRVGKYDDRRRAQVSAVQASTLGLLALVLGFTMSMAEARFNMRRQVLVAEANAIGTTYLRADFLPETERARSRELIRAYVASRVAYFSASSEDAPVATAHSQQLLADLWKIGAAVANEHPDWDLLVSYIETLNETIDLEATRDMAVMARVPALIRVLLVLVAFVAMGVTGYATGIGRWRTATSLYVMPVLIAVACGVITDLDRTRYGLVSSGDRPIERLQNQIEKDLGQANASR